MSKLWYVAIAWILFLGILLTIPIQGEDLLSQECANNGSLATCLQVPANQWTDISYNSGSTTQIMLGLWGTAQRIYVTRFDKSYWVPAIKMICSLGSHRDITSEPNRTWQCFDLLQNRISIWNNNPTWHTEDFAEGGHPMGITNVDPKTSTGLGQYGYTGSQASDNPRIGATFFDFIGQSGKMKMMASSLDRSNQLGSASYDVANDILVGVAGLQPTWAYDPATNALNVAWPISGTPPPNTTQNHSMSYDEVDGCIYVWGGEPTTSTVTNNLYKYCGNTSGGTWTALGPTSGQPYTCNTSLRTGLPNACPIARTKSGWTFDKSENKFFMFGGCDAAANITGANCGNTGANGSHILLDTWMYDPVMNAWTEQAPGCQPAANCSTTLGATGPTSTINDAACENFVKVPEYGMFFYWVSANGVAPHVWVYRYAPGGHVGLKQIDYSVSGQGYTQAPSYSENASTGTLNRNTTTGGVTNSKDGFLQTWAQGGNLGAIGNALLQAWAEFVVNPGGSSNQVFLRPWASSWTLAGGTVPMGSTAFSIMSTNTGLSMGFNPTIKSIGGTPYVCWDQLATGNSREEVYCNTWNGSAWNGQIQVGPGGTGAGVINGAFPNILDVGGVPTVAMREGDSNTPFAIANSYRPVFAYVFQFISGAWTALAGTGYNNKAINPDGTYVDSLSIATDGSNTWAGLTQFTPTFPTNSVAFNIANHQLLLYKWNGAGWAVQCGGDGRVSAAERPFNAYVTVMAGIPYVSYNQRLDGSTRTSNANQMDKLYVRKCSGGAWSTVGPGFLNKDQVYGWASRSEMVNDGSNIYIAWHEQGNGVGVATTPYPAPFGSQAQRPKVYVDKWNGSTWLALGGALNVDTWGGSATHPSLALLATTPTVLFGEVNSGSMRQMYIKQWDGLNWTTTGVSAPVSPIGGTVTAGSTVMKGKAVVK